MNAIKAYKIKAGLSYTDMARLIGVNTATLWRHAEGHRGVSFAIARKYHEKFKIPLAKIPWLCYISLRIRDFSEPVNLIKKSRKIKTLEEELVG